MPQPSDKAGTQVGNQDYGRRVARYDERGDGGDPGGLLLLPKGSCGSGFSMAGRIDGFMDSVIGGGQ